MCGMKYIIQSQFSTVSTVEVFEWISNFIPQFAGHVAIYPTKLGLKLTLVTKRGMGCAFQQPVRFNGHITLPGCSQAVLSKIRTSTHWARVPAPCGVVRILPPRPGPVEFWPLGPDSM